MNGLLGAAAAGQLPEWAQLSEKRRGHVARVAELLGQWAAAIAPDNAGRWRAAGLLHDALKDAPTETLRALVPADKRDWPEPLLHAAAIEQSLREQGVADQELLIAVGYHPIGHAGFGLLGNALYIADFIEPGRKHMSDQLERWRARMPDNFDAVLYEVSRTRIARQMEEGRPLRMETVEFWNRQVRARAT